MTVDSLPIPTDEEVTFQTGQVLTIAGGHFTHDTFTAFVSPLLPLIIEKLSLSLTLAGSLTAVMQMGALLNPFIGYLADKISLRYFVILAPAVTATLISSMGLAPNYFRLLLVLFVTGISVACFHAPAPAMIAEVSQDKVGQGMSLFMAGGELGRTVGPLLAVWAVSTWTLEGYYRIVLLGWAASLILFLRLRNVRACPVHNGSLSALKPALRSLFLPVAIFSLFRNLLLTGLSVYLPTFMNQTGASLFIGGAALSIAELAGVAGALSSGTLSDRLGRKSILLVAIISSAIFMLIFLNTRGWMLVPVLLALGFTTFSTTPVLLALVQEQLPNNRAVGNGLFMLVSFLAQTTAILAVGVLGDHIGLHNAFFASALLSLLAIPAILAMPGAEKVHSLFR